MTSILCCFSDSTRRFMLGMLVHLSLGPLELIISVLTQPLTHVFIEVLSRLFLILRQSTQEFYSLLDSKNSFFILPWIQLFVEVTRSEVEWDHHKFIDLQFFFLSAYFSDPWSIESVSRTFKCTWQFCQWDEFWAIPNICWRPIFSFQHSLTPSWSPNIGPKELYILQGIIFAQIFVKLSKFCFHVWQYTHPHNWEAIDLHWCQGWWIWRAFILFSTISRPLVPVFHLFIFIWADYFSAFHLYFLPSQIYPQL